MFTDLLIIAGGFCLSFLLSAGMLASKLREYRDDDDQ